MMTHTQKWIYLFLGILWVIQGCSLSRTQTSLEPVLSAEEYHDLGVTYEAREEFQFALDSYRRALELDRDYLAAWIHLGNTYVRMNRYEKAEEAYRQAIERDAASLEARNNLAWLYIEQKTNLEIALSLVHECAEAPSDYQAYCLDTSAMAHFYGGSSARALELLERAIRATPSENGELLSQESYHHGLVYRELHERDKAVQCFKQSIRYAPNSQSAQKSLEALQRNPEKR